MASYQHCWSLERLGALVWAILLIVMPVIQAKMVGSDTITPHDYVGMGPALLTNPPSCGMPYATLDITRITAVQAMEKTHECGTCLKVYNTREPTRFIYVLAVDTGGRGLDISIPSFDKLFGQKTDPAPASWAPTEQANCKDIYMKNVLPKEVVNTINYAVEKLPESIKNIVVPHDEVSVQAEDPDSDKKKEASKSSAVSQRTPLNYLTGLMLTMTISSLLLFTL